MAPALRCYVPGIFRDDGRRHHPPGAGVPGPPVFSRDENRSERITGDDDPILLPKPTLVEPETTGSVEATPSECNFVLLYLDRPPEEHEQDCRTAARSGPRHDLSAVRPPK